MSETSLNVFVLPNELLIEIFRLLLPSPSDTNFLSQYDPQELLVTLVLASVCRAWRQLTITTPELWTHIRVSEPRLPDLTLFLERSSPCLFDLIVPSHLFTKSDTNLAVIERTKPHFDRLRSLIFHKISLLDFQHYRDAFPECVAPSLQYLHICCLSTSMLIPDASTVSKPLFANAESLRSLSLRGLTASPLPLVNLIHLEIRGYNPTCSDFQKLFADCPALQTLCLPAFAPIHTPRSENDGNVVIESTSLRSFSFGVGYGHTERHCGCPLSFLVLPNLEYLEIIGNGLSNNLGAHFLNSLESNSFRKLSTLRMDDVVVGEDDVVFCQSLVSVTRLQVDHVQCLRALLDCSKSNDAHCFPQLTFLRYRSLYISDWKELAALIDAFVPRYPPSLQIEVSGEGYDATEYSHFFDEKTRIQFSQLNDRQLLACFTDGYDSLDEGMWSSEESPDEFGYDDYEYDWDEYWEDEGFEDFDDDYEELEDVY